MKKKILSMMLVLALMLSLSPAAVPHAHAEGGNEASVTIDGVTTEYATLAEALEKAYFKTVTIDLLTDVTMEESIELFTEENILLRGNGYILTGNSGQTISIQNAKLTLDNVHIRNSSGSADEVVKIFSGGTLTLQNDATVVSDTLTAIVNNGTLIITDGSVETYSESKYAIISEDAEMKLEAPAESEIHITSNGVNAVSARSGSVTIGGNLYMGGIRAIRSYTGEQAAAVKLSGALTGEPISVYYEHFSQLDTSDFAMIAPEEGYTITEDDAEMIKPQDIEFSAYLGEDGWIWAKYAHVHSPLDDEYWSLENGQHSFSCDCGETVSEDCTYEQKNDHEIHWLECISCGYIDPDSQELHTFQNCECECGYLGHQADQWIAAPDLLTHTGVCTACGEELSEEHAGIWGNDDDSHWWFCAKNCGYREESEAHGWSPYIPRDGQNSHYRQCYCGIVQEEYHTDSDNDLICEKCGGELCYDTDDDHRCDDCDLFMEMLCVDDDNNHRCDAELCGERVAAWCVDADNDHCCDVAECGTYLWELCIDDDGDWFCDVCRIDLCDHWLEDIVPNEDNTHTGVCGNCNRDITEDCTFADGMEWNDSMHWDCCICGRRGNEASHVYSEVISKTPVGHEKMCKGCDSTHLEAHRFVDGVCADCGTEQTDCYDVYVGGIGLKSGEYVDQAGNKTTTVPEGGYAHYENGVLTLHNYFYDGDGILWKEEPDTGSDIRFTAAIYATTELILELSGDNSLSNTSGEEDVQRDGIASEQDLIIRGQGSLNVLADNDGIHLRGGDLTIEEGILSLGALYEDENGDWVNIEIGDDGIDVNYGDVIIEGGDLTINSDDHGMDVGGNAIIHGGNVEVTGGDDGLNVEGDIVILNGNVNVEASDYGLDSDEGSVTIAGGCVTIYTHDWSGISADKNVDIRGGELYITAYDAGIEADHVTLSGGYMEIAGDWCDVYAEEITLHVELPEDAYLDDAGYEMIIWSDEGLVIDASAQEDELAPVVFCYNGKLLLENIPEGMTVMVAGYTDAQMTQLQMVADVTGDVVIREDILACEEVKAFFLNGGFVPVHISLPVM